MRSRCHCEKQETDRREVEFGQIRTDIGKQKRAARRIPRPLAGMLGQEVNLKDKIGGIYCELQIEWQNQIDCQNWNFGLTASIIVNYKLNSEVKSIVRTRVSD